MQIDNRKKLGNVLIVGAGISGLAAARKLTDEGFDVLVLESRNRTGGRIGTDRTLSEPVVTWSCLDSRQGEESSF